MKIKEVSKPINPMEIPPVKISADAQPLLAATPADLLGIEKSNSKLTLEAPTEAQTVPTIMPRILPPSLLTHFLLFDSVSDPDLQRYNDILRGKAREELKKFKTPGEMLGIKGGKIVSIPVPKIGLPHFTRGSGKGGGAAQGDGKPGDSLTPQKGDGSSGAGDQPGGHIQEISVPMTLSEIAELIIKDRKLPYLQPKGYGVAKEKAIRWNTKSKVGIDIDLQATIINALKRVGSEIGDQFNLETEEGLNALLDQVAIEEQDKVYISWREIEKPQVSAVIIYMMDVSGSVTDEMKEKVRKTARWLSLIIQYQFGQVRADLRGEKFSNESFGEGVEEVFIIHDAAAQEVTEEQFYTTRESGGTKISPAYELARKIIKERYDPDTWNVYAFHFSDGDNWGDDNSRAIELIEELSREINEFGYIQVASEYGSGEFYDYVKAFTENQMHVRTVKIAAAGNEDIDKVIDEMFAEKGDKKD
ncbi:MAG: DUF444 family protein [Candidatus Melainabacteria bacterium]|nr:DUF444 family protein [Candidatus Melainabacteria bacterium]